MPSTANKFFADIIDIYDNCLPKHAKGLPTDLLASYNKVRKSLGKEELKEEAADPSVTYFSADTSVESPIVTFPVTGGTILITNAGFYERGWKMDTNSKLIFQYPQSAFQDSFFPVSLQLTAVATVDASISLTVNQVVLLDNSYPISHSIGQEEGVFDIIVPAPCFLGGTNTFELVVTGGGLFITKVEVVSATGTGNIDDSINALTQVLARLGAETGLIKNTWPNINSTIAKYSQLASFVQQGKTLQDTFDILCSNLKLSAVHIRTFCKMYNTTYLPNLLSPTQTRQSKLDILKIVQQQVQDNQGFTFGAVAALETYKTSLDQFQSDLQTAATSANKDIQQQLEAVATDITNARNELLELQNKYSSFQKSLGISFLVGMVGALIGVLVLVPVGGFLAVGIAVVGVLALGVSVGYLISLGGNIADKQAELTGYLKKQNGLIGEQKEIQDMLEDVTNISQSLVPVAQYTQAFKDLWEFISAQLDGMQTEFDNFPYTNDPILFQMYMDRFTTQIQPYFNNVTTVLDAYINNF